MTMKQSYLALFGFTILFSISISGCLSLSQLSKVPRLLPKCSTIIERNISRSYKTLYIEQPIDHFGFSNAKTYSMRYLVADQFWNRNGGPIFFYTGNEGDIELFCENTGFMWDIAPEFKAMLVFAEHRYYGKSLPYGPHTYKNASNLNYLTSEQALADFATLIKYMKETIPGAKNSNVVAFGGSYGGMLSAWMRIKYPNMVVGSLAASAPVWQFTGLTPCDSFYEKTSNTWKQTSAACEANIHKSYSTMREIAKSAGGLQFLSSTFRLCTPLKNMLDLELFFVFLSTTYVNYAMVDYPYPANFLAKLPGWPIKAACSSLSKPLEGKALVEGLSHVTNVYYNYTGDAKCINWNDESKGRLGLEGWDYQSCTEMVMPLCSNGKGIFLPFPWNLTARAEECQKQFNVKPRRDWITVEYWGKQLKAASNIVFSNGDLDPWSQGGVLQSLSDSVVAVIIKNGAHHLDLRGKDKLDPPYVSEARMLETNHIRRWLNLTPQ